MISLIGMIIFDLFDHLIGYRWYSSLYY